MLAAIIAIVYAGSGAMAAPVPPEKVMPLEPKWYVVPQGFAFELSLDDGDVACAELRTTTECIRITADSWDGVVIRLSPGTKLTVMNCTESGRKGRLEKLTSEFLPPAFGYHFVVTLPPPGRCWWDAWCALLAGKAWGTK